MAVCNQMLFVLLLKHVRSLEGIGAMYPLSYLTSAGAYNVTGIRETSSPSETDSDKPTDEIIEAFWSSSNGALYAMEPVRSGLLPGLNCGWAGRILNTA